MYGHNQAPRAWYNRIDEFKASGGFQKIENEPTLISTEILLKKNLSFQYMLMNFFRGMEINQSEEYFTVARKGMPWIFLVNFKWTIADNAPK